MNGWFVQIERDDDESILIGPFDTEEKAAEHVDSTDVEDWCTDQAKVEGYTVTDVKVVHNPTVIPSYGVNAPAHPRYAPGAALGILS